VNEIKLVIALLKLVAQLIWLLVRGIAALAKWTFQVMRPKPVLARRPPPLAAADPGTAAPRPRRAGPDEAERRRGLGRALAAIERRAAALATLAGLERPNRRFQDALTSYVPATVGGVRAELVRASSTSVGVPRAVTSLELVLDEIEQLMRQRRDPVLAGALGDADQLADACYEPIIAFARAKNLPLTSGYPATQLGDFQLSIWTGFNPTSIAPIFLPRDFFTRVAWWPALGHEIGHDFLASVAGLDYKLRVELGLPSEDVGSRPLQLDPDGFKLGELHRLFGGWFEELFCDVFGTMMSGPSYVATMHTLFAASEDVREVLLVETTQSGSYDPHPPRHLRFLAGCRVLERAGLDAEARRLRGSWEARHTAAGRGPDRLLVPMRHGVLALPLEPFIRKLETIVDRLYAGPLDALGGFGLQGVSGLDYGPHEHAEGQRAKAALLRSAVPTVRDPRAVIAGAVLAALERPDLEPRILQHARAAIPAMGTGEQRPDAYAVTAGAGPRPDHTELVEAIALREILSTPRARGRRPLVLRRGL